MSSIKSVNKFNVLLSIMITAISLQASISSASESTTNIDPIDEQILKETERINTQRALEKFKSFFGFGEKFSSDEHDHSSERMCRLAVVPPDKATAGTIHLTFDDGPRRSTTPIVLDILKKYNIKATFFVLGSRVKGNEDIILRMVNEGHEVAMHSWDHPNFNQMSARDGIKQIEKTKAALDYIGVDAHFFRYPYGAGNCGTNDYLKDRGYSIVGWHIDTCDWAFVDGKLSMKENLSCGARGDEKDDFSLYALNQAKRDRGGIMLMHDIHQNTVNHLESIIQKLEQANFRFIELDNKNYFPLLNE